ncbi:PREDICTED: uncharacterized protein LOC108767175 [Trachymyrmex cornetzi]|uniref:uncharacterized protein LOC108767175 n=1 Tax=Trachymyrmex cornetzi TaxID=471704 RepID=UPI00084F217F|nr:PREDICTED: uncharacterized protein LOC108767175 [Trachymyrmex cornetzi]
MKIKIEDSQNLRTPVTQFSAYSNTAFTTNQPNAVVPRSTTSSRSRKKRRKQNYYLRNFAFNFSASSTVPQTMASTSTGVNRPQSFTSFMSNNEITKKQKISDNRIEIINHNLTRAIVSTNNIPSTMPQATASTSTGVKRPQNSIDNSVSNSEITKKQKTFDKRIEVINHHLIRAIVSTNNMPLGLEHLTLFRGAISKEIDKIVDGFIPKFHDSYIKFDAIVIKCVDQSSLYWLSTQIDNISPWPRAKLKMIIYNELQKYFRACVWIPGPLESSETVLKRLNRQNPDLNTANWQIFAENLGAFKDGRSIFLGVPESDFKKLEASNFMAYLGLGQINFAFNNIN